MAALIVRNLPEHVHAALRRLAAERKQPVEALVRETLSALARRPRGGIDFEKLALDRAAMGLHEDGPEWAPAMDEPALSRKVLGLSTSPRKRKTKK